MVDSEALLIGWLKTALNPSGAPPPRVSVATETPPDLEARLPWVQVVRLGGSYDGFRLDRPELDVDVYAGSGTAASELALRIQQTLHVDLARTKTGAAVVTRVDTVTGPHLVPHENQRLRRYVATYRLTVHPA